MSDTILAQTSASQSTSNPATTSPPSSAINTTGATMIVAMLATYTQTSPTPPATFADSASNTWIVLPWTPAQVQDGLLMTYAYCFSPTTSASHTFTIKGSFATAYIYAFQGTSNAIGNWSCVPIGTQVAGTTVQPGAIAIHAGDTVLAAAGGSGTGTWSSTTTGVNDGFVQFGTDSYVATLLNASAGSINPTFNITLTGNAVALSNIVSFTHSASIPAAVYSLVQEVDNFASAPQTAIPTLTTSRAVTAGDLIVAWVTSGSLNYSQNTGGDWQIISDDHNYWVPIYGANRSNNNVNNQLLLGFVTFGEYASISAWYCIATRSEVLNISFFNSGNSSTNSNGNANTTGAGPVNGITDGSIATPLTSAWCQLMEFSGNSLNPFFGKASASSNQVGTGTTAEVMIPGSENNLGIALGTAGSIASGFFTTIGAGWTDPTGGTHPDNSAQILLKNAGGYTPMGISTSGVWQMIGASFLPNTNPKYTVSGSLGSAGAGAQVTFISTTTLYPQYATANGSGNYSISLDIDTYYVVVDQPGQLYSSTTVTVSNSNVTQNFTGTAVSTNLVFAALGSNNFQVADQNPISGWSGDGGVPPGDPIPAIFNQRLTMGFASDSGTVNVSGTAVTWVSGGKFQAGWARVSGVTTLIVIGGTSYAISSVNSETSITLAASAGTLTGATYSVSGIVWNYTGPWSSGSIGSPTTLVGPNGYTKVTVAALNAASGTFGTVGINQLPMASFFNLGNGTMTVRTSDYGPPVLPSISGNLTAPSSHPVSDGTRIYQPSFTYKIFPFTLGDSIAVANIGTTCYVLHNGVVVANYTDPGSAPVSAAASGVFMYGQQQSDVAITYFENGNVTVSPSNITGKGNQVAAPIAVTFTDGNGLIQSSGITEGSFVSAPCAVVFCTSAGLVLALTGNTPGSYLNNPTPVVICNSAGLAITGAFSFIANGTSFTVTQTAGAVKGNPIPIVFCDTTGKEIVNNATTGAYIGTPLAVTLTDYAGYSLTLS